MTWTARNPHVHIETSTEDNTGKHDTNSFVPRSVALLTGRRVFGHAAFDATDHPLRRIIIDVFRKQVENGVTVQVAWLATVV